MGGSGPYVPPARAEREPDASTRFIVGCLDYYRWTVPYEWAAAIARRRGGRLPENFIASYAGAWLAVLSAIFAFVPQITRLGSGAKWGAAVISLWCVSDVTRWWLSLLINRRHNHFVSFERNFIYLFANLAEVAVGGAVLLRMTSPGYGAERALFDSFFLTTQVSNAPHASALHDAAQAIIAMASLILLAGALAILVGGIGRYLVEGEYKGPWTLPVPRFIRRIKRRTGRTG
jgi:hypothetical protein